MTTFHLEAVGLGRLGCSVPFDQVVVRPVQVLVQLDDQALEEGAELSGLGFELADGACGVRCLRRLLDQAALDLELPLGDAVLVVVRVRFARVHLVGYEDAELLLGFHWSEQMT